jgi:hypothetical protein
MPEEIDMNVLLDRYSAALAAEILKMAEDASLPAEVNPADLGGVWSGDKYTWPDGRELRVPKKGPQPVSYGPWCEGRRVFLRAKWGSAETKNSAPPPFGDAEGTLSLGLLSKRPETVSLWFVKQTLRTAEPPDHLFFFPEEIIFLLQEEIRRLQEDL